MSEASLTGLRAVRPRGQKVFLLVLGLVLVGAAVWWFWLRPKGPIGAEEDASKVLVVGDDAAARAGQTLGDYGFSVTSMTLAQAETKAAEALGGQLTGASAALRLADHEGIGYVAFAAPSDIDLSGIALAKDSASVAPQHRFIVLSVGELGMPHRLTVGATEETLVEVPAWVELMRALFEQERLASTLFAESQLPMEAVKVHQAIAAAVEMHGAYNVMETKARRLAREREQRLVEAEIADPKPVILARPLEETRALPLADGGLLLFVRPRIVEGELDAKVRLEQLPSRQIWYQPPGKWGASERVRCDSLRGGVLPDSRASWLVDDTFTAFAFDIGDAWDVWVFDAKAGGCVFSRAGSLPDVDEREVGDALSSTGRVARLLSETETTWALRVLDPKGDAKTIELPGCTEASGPAWIDERRVALTCRFDPEDLVPPGDEASGDDVLEEYADTEDTADEEPENDDDAEPPARGDVTDVPETPPTGSPDRPPVQAWIYVLDVDEPTIAALPTASFDPDATAWRVRPVRGEAGLEILLQSAGSTIAGRLTAKQPASALLDAPPADAAAPRPAFVGSDVALPVVALGSDAFSYETIGIELPGAAHDIAPDGRRAVSELSPVGHVDPHGYDIAVVQLTSGATPTPIASSDRAGHVDPMFTADGGNVVFTSRYPVDIGEGLESAAQLLAIAQ